MIDLGDLREGYWDVNDLITTVRYVERNYRHVHIVGIGTNLGCYGSIKPTVEKMNQLVEYKNIVEDIIGRPLKYISGGATTNLPLVVNDDMPQEVNHLRIGEGILLGQDLRSLYKCKIENMRHDTFVLEAEIVEIKTKPSYPIGEIAYDAFGNKAIYKNKGNMLRAILAVGKQDFGHHDKLIPMDDKVTLIGSSSDHLIVDISRVDGKYEVGDTMSFQMYYQGMLYTCLSHDVTKVSVYDL